MPYSNHCVHSSITALCLAECHIVITVSIHPSQLYALRSVSVGNGQFLTKCSNDLQRKHVPAVDLTAVASKFVVNNVVSNIS